MSDCSRSLRTAQHRAPLDCLYFLVLEDVIMSNKLSVIQSLANLGESITSIASTVTNMRSLRKQDVALFYERLNAMKATCKARGIGVVARTSLDEMEKTFERINSMSSNAMLREMNMQILKTQHQLLCQNLHEYCC